MVSFSFPLKQKLNATTEPLLESDLIVYRNSLKAGVLKYFPLSIYVLAFLFTIPFNNWENYNLFISNCIIFSTYMYTYRQNIDLNIDRESSRMASTYKRAILSDCV